MSEIIKNNEYKDFIHTLKSQIQSAQIRAAVSVNQEMLKLYWLLGSQMVEKQKNSQWGDGLVKQVSHDLQAEFPDMKGLSYRNIKCMKQWYQYWYSSLIGQQAVAQLEDKATIGLLICQSKDKTTVEYALKETGQAMGVSEYQLTQQLPKDFQSSLPSTEEIEAEIGGFGDE